MTLPSLKSQLETHQIRADKRFGQHFLLDQNITDKITRLAGKLEGVNVIEIGPGPGGLTRSLLASDAKAVTVIEKDSRLLPLLHELAEYDARLTILNEDALKVSLPEMLAPPRAIIANLPYNVGTAMLIQWLGEIAADATSYQSLTLMFQKEVAERIAAPVGGKHYGRLAVLSQWLCDVQHLFDLPPAAFSPPPKVASSVIRLIPCQTRLQANIKEVERVTAAAFGQRRKMLRSSLKSLHSEAESWLQANDITPTARAEEIEMEAFIRLANAL
jgi:16S rRNA (adenine1518-N6/adenine1519-N6)-dimethyltransferase